MAKQEHSQVSHLLSTEPLMEPWVEAELLAKGARQIEGMATDAREEA